ncbi:MAG: acetyl-CoA carboxylase [Acidobacteriota bacterium]|jgi:acetyl-CoA carboxylase biotin carboxyl carrier protein|nr:acetyl-CoA carboxylase [Acidobacteriota bacterium]
MPIDDSDIQWLLSLAENENLAEIEVQMGEQQTLIKRLDAPAVVVAGGVAGPVELGAHAPIEPAVPENLTPILAPMSGVFYRAPSPESPVYVELDQEVHENDTVGLIEAMKLFNDVHCPVSGIIRRILVANEDHVEAGQTLMYVETT